MTRPNPDEEWYVWTVRPGKFEVVRRYIENNIPQVTEILYPTVTQEKHTKRGVKQKKSPLYAGYLFLRYNHDPKRPTTWLKIDKHPFITSYLGPCTAKDLASVNSLQKVDKPRDKEVDEFSVGDAVVINSGVFIGYKGSVSDTNSNSIGVNLEQGGKKLRVVFSPKDLSVVGG